MALTRMNEFKKNDKETNLEGTSINRTSIFILLGILFFFMVHVGVESFVTYSENKEKFEN